MALPSKLKPTTSETLEMLSLLTLGTSLKAGVAGVSLLSSCTPPENTSLDSSNTSSLLVWTSTFELPSSKDPPALNEYLVS